MLNLVFRTYLSSLKKYQYPYLFSKAIQVLSQKFAKKFGNLQNYKKFIFLAPKSKFPDKAVKTDSTKLRLCNLQIKANLVNFTFV